MIEITPKAAVALFKGLNTAFELISAGNMLAGRIIERQQQRAAEGLAITVEDINSLMDEGDIKAAAEKATISLAQVAKQQS